MTVKPIREPLHPGSDSGSPWAFALGLSITVLFIGILALAMPDTALSAALRGMAVWWEVLFPALFPFFVLSEMLLGFGVVHLAGTLLDPLMRPLFRLPGMGGFVLAMGFVSGYPVGARMTSRLMEQNYVNRDEGERMVAITTSSDPIFLIGAVCVGFFGSIQAAPVLATAHYGGALLIGLLYRFKGSKEKYASAGASRVSAPRRLKLALSAMHRARLEDGRPLGVLLQQSLHSSLQLIMIVGGLVVFFSVALEMLLQSGLLAWLKDGLAILLGWFGLPTSSAVPFVHGAFEVTLGARSAAGVDSAEPAALVDRVAAAAFVLSWAGLSVHAQVAGLMSKTSWRYGPFARARLLHGVLSVALVYLLWPLFT